MLRDFRGIDAKLLYKDGPKFLNDLWSVHVSPF